MCANYLIVFFLDTMLNTTLWGVQKKTFEMLFNENINICVGFFGAKIFGNIFVTIIFANTKYL